MRMPVLSLLSAALLLFSAPTLAHADGDGGDAGPAINCPLAHAAPATHPWRRTGHHLHRGGQCPTVAAGGERRAWISREPVGPLAGGPSAPDEWGQYGHPGRGFAPQPPMGPRPYGYDGRGEVAPPPPMARLGPPAWRPAQPGPAPQGYAPGGYPPQAYADERGFERRGPAYGDEGDRAFDHHFASPGYGERGYAERGYGDRSYGDRGLVDRGFGERGYGDHAYGDRSYGDRDLGEHGYGARAYGYSSEQERSWSRERSEHWTSGGALACGCGRVSTTDQYGFLTWPGKTHFWHGQPMDDADGDPQAPIIVHP
jgi:hypothetical protein